MLPKPEEPVYKKWDDIPEGLYTKTTLYRDHGMKLAKDQQPVAYKKRYNRRGSHIGYYELYNIRDCVPKKKATPAQLAALEKARYMSKQIDVVCSLCGGYWHGNSVTRKKWLEEDYENFVCLHCEAKQAAIAWAREKLQEDFVILDTETSDLYGEIIEIAAIDRDGEALLNQRIKPDGDIAAGAYQVHGISLGDLKDCPTFPEVYPDIKRVIEDRFVLIYNADYDTGVLSADCRRHGLKNIQYRSACVMTMYARYFGDYSTRYGDYRFQPLNGGHDALGDCRATLAVLHHMANDQSFDDMKEQIDE